MLVRDGVAHPPPFTLFTIAYKVAVYASAKRADTLTLFHPYVLGGSKCQRTIHNHIGLPNGLERKKRPTFLALPDTERLGRDGYLGSDEVAAVQRLALVVLHVEEGEVILLPEAEPTSTSG